nr:MAG TPA: hypothetical protein [Caudoviricetes sp.]
MAKCKKNRNKTKRNFTVKTPTANRNYKDTVFRMLFSDRKNLLSLYNAVNQSDYNNPDDLCSCAKFLTQILIFFDTNFSAFSGSILRKLICIFLCQN